MPHSIEQTDTVKLWIGTAPDPAEWPTIVITKEDYSQLPAKNARNWDKVVEVQDQVTGQRIRIRRAECGLPRCRCALEFVGQGIVLEHFEHDACPGCGRPSVPLEGVPDQSGHGCGVCGREWFEDLNRPAMTRKAGQQC